MHNKANAAVSKNRRDLFETLYRQKNMAVKKDESCNLFKNSQPIELLLEVLRNKVHA